MKRIAFLAPVFALAPVAAVAGNVEAARMDPEVIEAAAAGSSADGMVVMGIMIAALLLAILGGSSTSAPIPNA